MWSVPLTGAERITGQCPTRNGAAKGAKGDGVQDRIFKIFRPEQWEALQRSGLFEGSPDDLRDGFIHFSGLGQLRGTLAKYYASEPRVVIAAVRTDLLGGDLRWEVSRDGQLFPHLYAPLALAHVGAVEQGDPRALMLMADEDLEARF